MILHLNLNLESDFRFLVFISLRRLLRYDSRAPTYLPGIQACRNHPSSLRTILSEMEKEKKNRNCGSSKFLKIL